MREISRLRRRLLLARAIRKRGTSFSFFLFLVGVVALLSLPFYHDFHHKRISFDENALLPEQISSLYGQNNEKMLLDQDVLPAVEKGFSLGRLERAKWVSREFKRFGLTSYIHKNLARNDSYSVYAIMTAPKGDGAESMFLTTSWENEKQKSVTKVSVALVISLASFFRKSSYWAKDLVFVVGDDISSIESFVYDYHSHDAALNTFMHRAGEVQSAIHIGISAPKFNAVLVEFYGRHGQLPNLDILMLFTTVLERRNLEVTFCTSVEHFRSTGQSGYTDNLWRLGAMLFTQALELSHGPHSTFKLFGIDALSIFTYDGSSHLEKQNVHTIAYALESAFVSLNNLIERLHHSVFFYIALTPSDMIRFSTYIVIPILMHVAVLLAALSMWLRESENAKDSKVMSPCKERLLVKNEDSKCPKEKTIGTSIELIMAATAFVSSFLSGSAIFYLPDPISKNTASILATTFLILFAGSRFKDLDKSGGARLSLSVAAQGVSTAAATACCLYNYGLGFLFTLFSVPVWMISKFCSGLFPNSRQRYERIILLPSVILLHPAILASGMNWIYKDAGGIPINTMSTDASTVLWFLYYPVHFIWTLLLF